MAWDLPIPSKCLDASYLRLTMDNHTAVFICCKQGRIQRGQLTIWHYRVILISAREGQTGHRELIRSVPDQSCLFDNYGAGTAELVSAE